MPHKSGFVNIIGNPNVGKSTLMNELVGEKLSIVTRKVQTTRHRILGIVNGDDYQIVFSDTPGIIQPKYKLHQAMMKFVEQSFEDADVIVFVAEAGETPLENNAIYEIIKQTAKPLVLLINKIDIYDDESVNLSVNRWKTVFPEAEIIPVSALKSINLDVVKQKIISLLPPGEAYYSKDELTDKPIRFFVSEIIREKILLNYSKEIPYSVEVVTESYKEDEIIIRIASTIFVSRESQKGIILGHKGSAIKKLGIAARKDIEDFAGKKVYLDLSVKVKENWRNDTHTLEKFGYEI